MSDEKPRRCGYVALLGPPNAGKSTLLNSILGSKLAITSAKPQTTRDRIVGIHTDDTMQAVFLDTPGVHEAWTELNKQMVARSRAAIGEADVVCWLGDMTSMARRIDAGDPPLDANDEQIGRMIRDSGRPVIFVANKIDVVPHHLVLPVIAAVTERVTLAAAVPISALTGDAVPTLLKEVRANLPEGPMLFPEDEWAQVTERFVVAELVREKIFHLTAQEVPYSTFVDVVRFDESERETRKIVRIYADIVVERGSQKGIIIGKGGEMLKRIGTLARKELQEVLECRVYLELFVKVERDWTRSERGLRRVGFTT
ncbi:MAG: GTP-binding protein Era [Myxococcota bacterium]